jgi:hypothetical protein
VLALEWFMPPMLTLYRHPVKRINRTATIR